MLAFLLSPLGRKLMAVLAIAGLLWGAYAYAYGKGKSAGVIEGQAAQLETDRKQFEQDRQEFLATLQKYKAQDDAAKQAIAQKDSELASIKSRRESTRKAIEAVPDSGLVSDIHSRLGVSDSPSLSATDLRSIDLSLGENESLRQAVATLEAKSQAQDQRISALEGQKQAAVDAYNKLVPMYAKAYNAAQKKHSLFVKIITLGIVHDKHMDLPEPPKEN